MCLEVSATHAASHRYYAMSSTLYWYTQYETFMHNGNTAVVHGKPTNRAGASKLVAHTPANPMYYAMGSTVYWYTQHDTFMLNGNTAVALG